MDWTRPAVWSHSIYLLFLHFKTSPHLLQLFRRTLQHCFAVKLQKCFRGLKYPALDPLLEYIITEFPFYFFFFFDEFILWDLPQGAWPKPWIQPQNKKVPKVCGQNKILYTKNKYIKSATRSASVLSGSRCENALEHITAPLMYPAQVSRELVSKNIWRNMRLRNNPSYNLWPPGRDHQEKVSRSLQLYWLTWKKKPKTSAGCEAWPYWFKTRKWIYVISKCLSGWTKKHFI